MKKIWLFFIILILVYNISVAYTSEKSLPEFDAKIQKIVSIQKKIKGSHPFLENLYSVAIAHEGHFYIYRFDHNQKRFKFSTKMKTPFPIQKGMKAAFPINGEMMCVVTPEIFNTEKGYVFIFHEFIHCHQAAVCEQKLKGSLDIYKRAMEKQNWSWELNHKFPYKNQKFMAIYSVFIKSLEEGDKKKIKQCRANLKKELKKEDYEYMVWQEWKEGFARYVENLIRNESGWKENNSGSKAPYNRVSFYAGGERFIKYLISRNPELNTEIERLFTLMKSGDI